MSFKNQTVIITGASRGIGLSIAEHFAKEGANIAICSTNDEKAKATAQSLASTYGVSAYGQGLDIKNFDAVSAFIKQVANDYGQIDVLVNNAGITKDNLLLRLDESDWNDVIETNLNSIFNTTKSAIKFMLKKNMDALLTYHPLLV